MDEISIIKNIEPRLLGFQEKEVAKPKNIHEVTPGMYAEIIVFKFTIISTTFSNLTQRENVILVWWSKLYIYIVRIELE